MSKAAYKREIAMISSEYWAEEALFTDNHADKALMYKVAANSAEEYDKHHATVLRRLANFYREGTK